MSRYSSLKHKTMTLRNTAGPEMSIITATVLSEKPMGPELYRRIRTQQVLTDESFRELDSLSLSLEGTEIFDSLGTLKEYYYQEYAPLRDSLLIFYLVNGRMYHQAADRDLRYRSAPGKKKTSPYP